MKILKLILVLVVTSLAFHFAGMSKAQDSTILDSELFLVSPGQIVDWSFWIKIADQQKISGRLDLDQTTSDPVWSVQGCIAGYCFMTSGGPPQPVEGTASCRIRFFVPSDFSGEDKHAKIVLTIYAGDTEVGVANLHVMSIKSLKANFVAGEKPIQVSEIKLENCVPTRTITERTIISKAAPSIINGSMMIPFRVLGEIIGAEVGWNSNTSEASYILGPKKVILRKDAGKARIVFAGYEKSIEVKPPPANIRGNIMVPLRFVTAALGGQTSWDAPTKTATIQFPGCTK